MRANALRRKGARRERSEQSPDERMRDRELLIRAAH